MYRKNTKTYTELSKLPTFEERYNYLKLSGSIGEDTFGYDRYINQMFYKSEEWKKIRNYVITRDNGCDLGCSDHKIFGDSILIHHINPITKDDIINKDKSLLDPENLITTIKRTHDAIHYGSDDVFRDAKFIERSSNDMCPWKNRRNNYE